MALIEMRNIRKVYNNGKDNQVEALKDINLTVNAGEFVAIMGPSGSGKSTLMHIIGFLDRASGGQFFFDGEDVTKLNDYKLAEIRNEKIGFVFQTFNLLATMTAYENVELPMKLLGRLSNKQIKLRTLELLAKVGLQDRVEHLVYCH